MGEVGDKPQNGIKTRLDRLAARAELVLLFERVWPPAVWLLSLAALFVAVSWAGLWLDLPRWGRIAGVLAFAAAALAALLPLARLRRPDRREQLARLDRDAGLPHQPATGLDDELANGGGDPATRILWEVHRRRLEAEAARLSVRPPSPRMVERDRYALRAAALVALVAAAFIAGPEKFPRLMAAFDWRTPGTISEGFRVDAWIDPPAYTGRPPIMLTGLDSGGRNAGPAVSAPAGSIIMVRATGTGGFSATATGGLQPVDEKKAATKPAHAPPPGAAPVSGTSSDSRWTLHGSGRLVLARYGSTLASFDITAIPDKPPTIALKGLPRNNLRGTMTLRYHVADDYGVASAEALVALPLVQGKAPGSHPLVEPPRIPLQVPPGASGDGETTADVAQSPWAGARVSLTLSAKDEAGNVGFSTPTEITLPQRVFTKPLARALVEQRRKLILTPEYRDRVFTAIEALMIAPEEFGTSPSVYLGLRSIELRLVHARSNADLLAVAALMWEMALSIEDGNLSQAERDLRSAQQALREALQRHAPPDEIRKRMNELRAALDKFMNQLAEQQRQNGNRQQMSRMDRNTRVLTERDLKAMLDRMENMAKDGDTADAQRMLDQLQSMLDNLQTAQRGRGDPAQQQMNQAMSDLDRMMRDQSKLRDKTFRHSQKERDGMQGEGGRQSLDRPGPDDRQMDGEEQGDDQSADRKPGDDPEAKDLQKQQQALRDRLEELQRQMKQFGMKGAQGFEDAQEAMKEAEQGLGQGRSGQDRAVGAQGRALEALRRGSRQLAQQMQANGQAMGQQPGDGELGDGQMREGSNGTDPLGRDRFGEMNPHSRYDPLGVPAAERARRVLEELRRRLGNTGRPQEELDYLERLLNPY